MKLGNRMFLGVFGLIVFSTVAGTVTGALLISAAVRAEALSRVEQGLREARSAIEGHLRDLALTARILARGLDAPLGLPVSPDITVRFPSPYDPGGALPASLAAAGLSGAVPARGYLVVGPDLLAAADYDPASVRRLAACSSGQLLCLFALEPGEPGPLFAATVLNGNEALVREIQARLFGEAWII